MKPYIRNILFICIVAISTCLHLPHFSKDLVSMHVWRQTQTQSTITNFYEEDMSILHPKKNDRGDTDGIFRMEFPLMQWLIAGSYKIFGPSILLTRISMFLFGLLTTLGMYRLLQALFHQPVLSLIGAWAFTFSPSFFYHTINPMPDIFALGCSVWGLALFYNWRNNHRLIYLLSSGFMLALGALSKLPFILFFAVPFVYFCQCIIQEGWQKKQLTKALAVLGFVLLPLAWYITVIPQWETNGILTGMLNNNETSTQLIDYLLHNALVNLPELLLNYGSVLFFLSGFYFLIKRKSYRSKRFLPLLSFSLIVLAYYLFEANAIKNVHDYYLFPFYPSLFILVAYGASHLLETKQKAIRAVSFMLLLALPLICFLRMESRWNYASPGFNSDLLTYKEELRNAVPDDALVLAGNDESKFIYLYYIHKKGWAFRDNYLPVSDLAMFISKGAQYIYIDSDLMLQSDAVQQYLGKLVVECGSIHVYQLKQLPLESIDGA